MNRRPKLNFIIGVIALWVISYLTINANVPHFYAPFSFTAAIPVLLLYGPLHGGLLPYVLGTSIVPILFSLWSFPLLKAQENIPRRTKGLSALLIALSLYFLASSWSYGINYQGKFHTIMMYLFNVLIWAGLYFINRKNFKTASYSSNFLYHWLFFAWLGWVAFPWLGELP